MELTISDNLSNYGIYSSPYELYGSPNDYICLPYKTNEYTNYVIIHKKTLEGYALTLHPKEEEIILGRDTQLDLTLVYYLQPNDQNYSKYIYTLQDAVNRAIWAETAHKYISLEWSEENWKNWQRLIEDACARNSLSFWLPLFNSHFIGHSRLTKLVDQFLSTKLYNKLNFNQLLKTIAVYWIRTFLEQSCDKNLVKNYTEEDWSTVIAHYESVIEPAILTQHTLNTFILYIDAVIQEFIEILGTAYSHYHQNKEHTYKNALEFITQQIKQLDTHKKLFIKSINPFSNSIAMIPTSPPIMSGAMALLNSHNWTEDESGEPRYRTTEFNKYGYIEHHIIPTEPSTDEITTFTKLTAWEITKSFDVHTARLHLLMSTYAIKNNEPWREEFTLKGTDLIHLLGNKRTDLTKHEKLTLVRKQVNTLFHLGVYIKWIQNKLNLCTEASRMWDIKITSIYDDLFEEKLSELIIEGRAGLWAKGFLNRAGQENKTALFQYGYLADKILQIDPYHSPFAAKAMIYLTLQKQRQTFLVSTLLEKVVGKEGLVDAQNDYRKRHELKQQFEDFLLTAKELQCTIEFDETTYPKNMRPDFAQENLSPEYKSKLPPRYFESWLKGKLTILLPEPIPTLLNSTKEIQPKKQVKKLPSLTGNTIRQAREAKNYSVRQLAQKLNVAPISVSRWESGQRKLTPENEKELRKILNIT